jgi:selenocysteine lyase/cysteine desulfurase
VQRTPDTTVPAWDAYRRLFPTLERAVYFNTCSLGALSSRSRAGVVQFLDLWEELGASAWYELWLGEIAALRRSFEQLINAPNDTTAIHHSVSSALSVIGSCYTYAERNKIITTGLDFPTIPYQWLVKPNVEVVVLPSPDGISVPLEHYRNAIDERTALVATSHVFFTSGYIQPVNEIVTLAHHAGAHAMIDGYQAAGQVPVDVQAMATDWYVTGGLKWMLGGPGIVELYAKPELIRTLEPTITGWFAHAEQFRFAPNHWQFGDDARRFELGTPAVAAVYAARAGIDLLLEIGVKQIRQRELELVADLVARAHDRGLRAKLPANMHEHAGIVMFPADDPAAIVRSLAEQRIIVDHRPGHVRVSPFFYNTMEEHEVVVEQLAQHLHDHDAQGVVTTI